MNLYYAEWPNKTVTIAHAKNSIDLFFLLDEEGDPYQATVWTTKDACSIQTSRNSKGLHIDRDTSCVWARVLMPGLDRIYKGSCVL